MCKSRDVVIIGAGPAGSALAATLAQQGWDVLLVEREAFPRHKVCGEFLSPEAQSTLHNFDLHKVITALHPVPITQAKLVTRHGLALQTPLPGCAWGLSRYALDRTLADAAIACGVDLQTGKIVTSYEQTGKGYVVHLQGQAGATRVPSRAVIAAGGRHTGAGLPPQARTLDRKFLAVGVKAHYVGVLMPPTVELFFFPGGYVGVSPVEDGRVNVCLLASYTAFARAGKRIESMLAACAAWNPAFGQRLAGGEFIADAAVAVAPVDVYRPAAPWAGIACVGDTAAMIPPLCGDGMAMALRSAELCAPLAHDFLAGSSSLSTWAECYTQAWHAEFDRRLRMGRLLQRLLSIPQAADGLIRLGRLFPSLATFFVGATRGC